MRKISCLLALLGTLAGASPVCLRAEEAPKKSWKNVTEASLVSANGNTNSSTYEAKDTFSYDWKKSALELVGSALGAENDGESTAEQYLASQKFSYKLTDRNYAFEKFTWNKDRFAGIKNRNDATAGLGRELIKSERNEWLAELGGGFVSEERTVDEDNEFTSGRAYTKYIHIFTPTATFSQDVEYQHNFENRDDFRINTETSLISALSTHFSLKVSYRWKHVGVPPLGFVRNDTITSVALIASY